MFPDIRDKWPSWYFDGPNDKSKPIIVQQDNARPHVPPGNATIMEEGKRDGFDIRVKNQPANSPDLNVLDLGIFNAIDKLQKLMECQSINELVNAVVLAFYLLPTETIDCCFMTMQVVIGKIINCSSDNMYRMPHLHKTRIIKVFGIVPKYV